MRSGIGLRADGQKDAAHDPQSGRHCPDGMQSSHRRNGQRVIWSGRWTPWADRWRAPSTRRLYKLKCSTPGKARRCIPCGRRRIKRHISAHMTMDAGKHRKPGWCARGRSRRCVTEQGRVCGVRTACGAELSCRARGAWRPGVYLKSRVIIGEFFAGIRPFGTAGGQQPKPYAAG